MTRRKPSSTVPGLIKTVRRRRKTPAKKRPAAGRVEKTVAARQAPGRAAPLGAGVPDRLGPYRLIEVLGEGGMGTVFLAEETENLRRRVAVKWIRTALYGRHARQRFAAESQALARMNHSSIAQVFEAGTDEKGRPYIVMEYVPGERITEHCARTGAAPDAILALLCHLARGLLHAHRQGILHRDVKPSNVLVKDDPDEGAIPKIIDFGLAKRLDATVELTRPGDVLGTPAYMSPEQLRGDAVDHRTDIYAFGVLMRELFTGRPDSDPEAGEAYPSGLGHVVGRCVAPDPQERYADFAVVLEDLESMRPRLASPASEGELQDALRRLFESGPSPAAERLLEVFEDAAARSTDLLRSTVAAAGRLRDAHRRSAAGTRRLVGAAADAHLAAVLGGFVLGGGDERRQELLARAADTYRDVLDSDPELLRAGDYVAWGDALLQMDGEIEGAAQTYRQAVELDRRSASAHYGLAVARFLESSSPESWTGDAWRALELDSGSAAAHNHLGVVLFESRLYPEVSLYGKDKLREAVSAFEKALAIDADAAAIHFNLAVVLLARGRDEAAADALRRAAELGGRVARFQDLATLVDDGEAMGDAGLQPLVILPCRDPGRSSDPYDEAAALFSRGRALAWDDPDAARELFVRAEQGRRETGNPVS